VSGSGNALARAKPQSGKTIGGVSNCNDAFT